MSRILRRSFLLQVTGAAALLGGAFGRVTGARAQGEGPTDSDPNDQVGQGLGAVTDSDSGPQADGAGLGRGPRSEKQTGATDQDAGANADQGGFGRGPRRTGAQRRAETGATDSDSGPAADPPGRGRGGPNALEGATDADPTDRAGRGRGERVLSPDAYRTIDWRAAEKRRR